MDYIVASSPCSRDIVPVNGLGLIATVAHFQVPG
jgi:hypothetical protein